jgi:hypothetical protein
MTDKPTEDELRHPTSYPHPNRVNVSREIAEARADLGEQATLGQIQAFDGEHGHAVAVVSMSCSVCKIQTWD